MKEKFIAFLKTRGAYPKFVCNLSDMKGETLNDYFERNPFVDSYVEEAFDWDTSPEQYDYWNYVDVDWRNITSGPQDNYPVILKDELEDIAQEMIMMAEKIRKLTSNKAIEWPEVDDE